MAEDKSNPPLSDSTDFARVFAEIALRSKHLVETRLADRSRHAGEEQTDEFGVGRAFTELAGKLMSDPFKLAEMSMRMSEPGLVSMRQKKLPRSTASVGL